MTVSKDFWLGGTQVLRAERNKSWVTVQLIEASFGRGGKKEWPCSPKTVVARAFEDQDGDIDVLMVSKNIFNVCECDEEVLDFVVDQLSKPN